MNYALFWTLTRLFTTAALGGFSLLMNIFLMVQLLPLLGLTVPLMRRIATAAQDIPREVSNAFFFAAPISVALALVVGIWGQIAYGRELESVFWLVGASLLPTAWTIVAEATLLGRERVAAVARFNLIEALLRTSFAVASAWLGYGLVGVFVVFLAVRFVAAALYAIHPDAPLPKLRFWRWELQRRNWHEVPVFMSIALVAALVSRLDIITLSHLRGLHEAATYSAASRLYDAAQIIPTVTALVVLPTLARQFVSAREEFGASLALTVQITLMLGLGVALVMAAFAQPIIDLLYRPEMADAALVLRFLIFAAVVMMIDVILSSTMLAASAQKDDLRSLAVGLGMLTLSLSVLTPSFGPAGVAMSVTLGLVTRSAVRLRWAVRTLNVPSPWLHLARLAAATAFGVAALHYALPHGVLAGAFAALASYAAAVVLLGTLGRHPLKTLRSDVGTILHRGTSL